MIEPKIAVGICVKCLSPDLNMLLETIPDGSSIFIVSGTEDDLSRDIFVRDFDLTYYSNDEHGYDLVRNRGFIFEKFNLTSNDLLLYLDDDEYYPDTTQEFAEFFESDFDVGMLAHDNVYKGKSMTCTGTNYHARLFKKGDFLLQGKVIESVKPGASKKFLNIKIRHDFVRSGMEHLIQRINLWAKETSSNNEVVGMRTYIVKVRRNLGLLSPLARFCYHYIYLRGFLSGRAGFYLSMNYAIGEYLHHLYKFEKR